MSPPSLQGVVITCALAAGAALAWLTPSCARHRVVDAGFWFEQVAFDSSALAPPMSPQDVEVIAAVARSELIRAFGGLRITISERRDATYRVRVVQQLRDLRFRRYVAVAGESRAVSGFGGSGAVNFEMLANSAVGYAPEGTGRAAMLEAIGRGIGRAAVHEFVHQLLPTAPIHDSTDVTSYEFHSAARAEQYYGEMHWDLAWPLLQQRLGPSASQSH